MYFSPVEGKQEVISTMSLIEFCRSGDLGGVKAVLESGADVNTKDEYGDTGLIWAVRKNCNSVVAFLLRTPNIDVNWKGDDGWCALHLAVVLIRNTEMLKLMLKVPSIDVNCVNKYGWGALYWAVQFDNIEALKLLLDIPNIDVNIVTNSGWSAVYLAAFKNNIEALKLLLNVPNIDVNIVNNCGRSAVHAAVVDENIEVLKLLLSQPDLTILNHRDRYGGATPVMLAVQGNKLKALALLVADLRVNLDTNDKEGRSLEDVDR